MHPDWKRLLNKHRIAKAEKPITFFFGFFIGFEDKLTISKGHDKHQQGAFGYMQICDDLVHKFPFIAWVNEYVGFTGIGS